MAAALAGCISIFPKEKPAQLYRFVVSPPATPSAPPAPSRRLLLRATIGDFDRASSGDRILTVEGDKVAFVAAARWVEPAATLMNEALGVAFERSTAASLLVPGDLAAADGRLALDVQTFEVRYRKDAGGPPVVVIRIDANLETSKGAAPRREKVFAVETPAAADTLTAIVEAYDAGVTQTLGQIVDWVNAKG
jgi:cholesterol transport system auxiliary component